MDNIPRHKQENPFDYSDLELAKRKKAILDASRDYPHLPPSWVEMAYDIVENNEFEELKEKVNSSEPKIRENGGLLENSITIDNPLEPEFSESE